MCGVAERHHKNLNQKPDYKSMHTSARRRVPTVAEGQNAAPKDRSAEELGEESRRDRDPGLRLGVEIQACRVRDETPIEMIDVVEVDANGKQSANKATSNLREDVSWDPPRRKATEEGEHDGEGRVDEATRTSACDIDGEHDAESPIPVGRVQRAGVLLGRNNSKITATPDEREYKSAEEFCKRTVKLDTQSRPFVEWPFGRRKLFGIATFYNGPCRSVVRCESVKTTLLRCRSSG